MFKFGMEGYIGESGGSGFMLNELGYCFVF